MAFFIGFDYFRTIFGVLFSLTFYKDQKIKEGGTKMASVRKQWRPFYKIMTSSLHVIDLKGSTFVSAFNPPSFILIALMLYELQGEGLKAPFPVPADQKQARSE